MSLTPRITPLERAEIVAMLRKHDIFTVAKRSKRSFYTLVRLAAAEAKNAGGVA
jgi:hypothetical protein